MKRSRLSTADIRLMQELKRRMKENIPIERMVLYGSRARGDFREDSDYDVFIEVSSLDSKLRQQICEIAWEVGLEETVVISTFVASTKALKEGPVGVNPILKAIKSDGILI